jgi:nitrite reductase/ring-hydroxylating ferredoxin subunit
MLFQKKYEWKKVADAIEDIPGLSGGIGHLEVEGRSICIAPYNNQLHAFANHCPHAGIPLSEGWLDARGNIHCSQHGYCFNIQNGLNTSGEGYHLPCWPVEKRADGIYVGFR